jgi:hypothetical protein
MGAIHFVVSWAEAVCGPNRVEVSRAAEQLSLSVREVDVDEDMELARRYNVLQVSSVALEDVFTPVSGARFQSDLGQELQARSDGAR